MVADRIMTGMGIMRTCIGMTGVWVLVADDEVDLGGPMKVKPNALRRRLLYRTRF